MTPQERIAKLEERLKQERAKLQRIEARKRAIDAKKKRSDDTRRKILVGATILSKIERGEWPEDKLLAMLDSTLTRDDDRALFGLSTRSADSTSAPSDEVAA